ncbi:hypothetical protein SteCoe_16573 [Stentor coeruleus]|uniref:Uncharacterized protein n=1 Tax=Stentor coeruleus TaxID=5963 RepID=A0A1R2C0V3_9CILI|nr:hypothetical protein SteCoe_16573 [Stentor coeruleus]
MIVPKYVQPSSVDLRAQFQLYKAYLMQKASLSYQISQIKIKNSYKQSNPDYRDAKDLINLHKGFQKKLQDYKAIRSSISESDTKRISPNELSNVITMINTSEERIHEIEGLFSQNFNSENYINILKEKFEYLKELQDNKLQQFRNSEENINFSVEQRDTANTLEEQINDYKAELEIFNEENRELQEKKIRFNQKKRTSFDRIKNYHLLSENALQLRSKLLLREELLRNLKNAEKELENLSSAVESKRSRISIMEEETEENLKFAARYEVDFYEARKYLKKLEIQLEGLYREREELMGNQISQYSFAKTGSIDILDEGETISLNSLMTGFSEMKKEKDTLIQENNRLKERISKLFQAKV